MKNEITTKEDQRGSDTAAGIIGLALIVWALAAWFTHIVVCINEEAWGLLIAGAILFPIGMVHGTGVWFGFF